MFGGTILMWIAYNPLFVNPPEEMYDIYGWDADASVAALNEAKALIPPDACVVAENNIQPHYSARAETYVLGARGDDSDGCT